MEGLGETVNHLHCEQHFRKQACRLPTLSIHFLFMKVVGNFNFTSAGGPFVLVCVKLMHAFTHRSLICLLILQELQVRRIHLLVPCLDAIGLDGDMGL